MKKLVLLAMLMLFVPLTLGFQTPPFTVEFRGTASINGEPAPDNTEITALANNRELIVGKAVTGYGIGYFNHLEIAWDDPSTPIDEGITYDDASLEEVMFKINGELVAQPSIVTKSFAGQTIDISLNLDGREEKPADIAPEDKEYNFGMLLIFIGLVMILIIIVLLAQKVHKHEKK